MQGARTTLVRRSAALAWNSLCLFVAEDSTALVVTILLNNRDADVKPAEAWFD